MEHLNGISSDVGKQVSFQIKKDKKQVDGSWNSRTKEKDTTNNTKKRLEYTIPSKDITNKCKQKKDEWPYKKFSEREKKHYEILT